jgi:hypothetical protein
VVANATESLYSMINLDRVQECRPLHLTRPTPCHGRSTVAGGKSARSFSQPARSQPVASGEAVTKVTAEHPFQLPATRTQRAAAVPQPWSSSDGDIAPLQPAQVTCRISSADLDVGEVRFWWWRRRISAAPINTGITK